MRDCSQLVTLATNSNMTVNEAAIKSLLMKIDARRVPDHIKIYAANHRGFTMKTDDGSQMTAEDLNDRCMTIIAKFDKLRATLEALQKIVYTMKSGKPVDFADGFNLASRCGLAIPDGVRCSAVQQMCAELFDALTFGPALWLLQTS